MDTLRKSQYRKQNTAVKQQKSHMADNAAKSSRMVTGSSAYNKESYITFADFMFLEDKDPTYKKRALRDLKKLRAKREESKETPADRVRARLKKREQEREAAKKPPSEEDIKRFRARAKNPPKASEPKRDRYDSAVEKSKENAAKTPAVAGSGFDRRKKKPAVNLRKTITSTDRSRSTPSRS